MVPERPSDANGTPAYVTCVAETDLADGWREHRTGRGVAIERRLRRGRVPRALDAALAASARRQTLGAEFGSRRSGHG